MIKSISPATDEEWDSMVDAAETAVYFQTREWFEIWSEYAGFKNDTRLITFASGKKVLLPLCHQDFLGGLLKIHFLAPKGMGGFVTTDALDQEEKRELYRVLRQVGTVYARLNPFDALTDQFDASNANDSTQVMNLGEGFDNTYSTWSQDNRRRVRKGLAQGITAELASEELQWRSYYGLYKETLSRWGENATNAYDWSLFEVMFKRRSGKIKLWLAQYQGKPIAGAVVLYHNRFMVGWHTVRTLGPYRMLDPFHVLQYYILQDACNRGLLLYDFLGSGQDRRIEKFKSGFSARSRPVHVYKSGFMAIFTYLRQSLRRHALTRFLVRGMGS